MFSDTNVLDALRVCFDPELAVNIVDLGLVYGIVVKQDENAPGFEPRFNVSVELTMRTSNEERQAMLIGQVKNRLAGMPEISQNAVEMVWDPAWSADRMTSAARQQLGLDRVPKQDLISIKLSSA